MLNTIDKEKLIISETSFGCYKRYCHPKFKKFVSRFSRGRCLIKSDSTLIKVEEMKKIMEHIKETNKKILFVGTKKRIKLIVREIVEKTNHFYMNHHWIGGLLTNFNVAHKERNLKFREFQKKEYLDFINTRPKKEQMQFKKKFERLEKSIIGIVNMKSLPDYIFLIDPKNEKTALIEAKLLNIPILSITQMNIDPIDIEAFIPANDNSDKAVKVILEFLLEPFFKEEEIVDNKELIENLNEEKHEN